MYLLARTEIPAVGMGAKIILGSLFLGLSAQIALFLPFSPVPITLQTVAVLLLAAHLGKKGAALAVIAYIGEGLMGLPVFAGGSSGPAVFMGPRGLFLVSFIVMAYLAGLFYERLAKGNALKTFIGSAGAVLALYAVVLPSLSLIIGFGPAAMSVAPFILVDLIKILLCNQLIAKKNSL